MYVIIISYHTIPELTHNYYFVLFVQCHCIIKANWRLVSPTCNYDYIFKYHYDDTLITLFSV